VTRHDPDTRLLDLAVHAPDPSAALTLQLHYAEPAGGILAGLLALPGAPAVRLALDGSGPASG